MVNWFKRTTHWREQKLLVIDMEMTGLNPDEDSILSAGSVIIEDGRIRIGSSEHHFFLPTVLMGADVSESAHIHMITDTQIDQQGESLTTWLSDLSGRLKADAWVFHHAPIDLAFLKAHSARHNIVLPKVTVLDTLADEQARNAEAPIESHAQLNLNACRARYGLPVYRQHHAFSDALATAELFLAQRSRAD